MCFSVEADLVAGAAIVPLGVLALRHVRHPREVPLASLPLLLGAHQLVEALVWAGVDGHVSADVARAAAWVWVVLALPVLPLLVPVAVWLVEDRHRQRVLPFVVLGAGVTVAMVHALLVNGLEVGVLDDALVYDVGLGPSDWLSTALYVVAVVGSCLAASSWTLRAFGLINLLGLTLVALTYADSLASLWCLCAAVSSVLVLVHLVHRAREHDAPHPREPVAA
ncbi:MAG: hypothetical protein JWN84_1375 [Nocardioides sp.]|jgi:hypothetical protein|nr:hypothetical protein [Nocardioides sp.]